MMEPHFDQLCIKLFADGADLASIERLAADPRIKGFTTNPTLMRAAGVTDYRRFADDLLNLVPDRPVCLELFADDLVVMGEQAREIASWGRNIYVKIPVSTTRGEFCGPVIAALSSEGVKLNVTALMTIEQVVQVRDALAEGTPAIVSVFAGRIADTGRDPVPHMARAAALLRERPEQELLWASSRELLNVFHADAAGCHIITVTAELIRKLSVIGHDLDSYSRETVAMFRNDALAASYEIPLAAIERPGQRVVSAVT
jgi:transaldolase